MIIAVINPLKKKNKASAKLWGLIEEKYPKMHHHTDYIYAKNYIIFWKKDSTHVTIFEYKKNHYSIFLTGSIIFEGVKLNDVVLEYMESKNSFDDCVVTGLKLLSNKNI